MIKFLRTTTIILTFICVILLTMLSSEAESLWRNNNMFVDRQARAAGDIITIIIQENAVGTNESASQRDKSVKIGGKAEVKAENSNSTIFNSLAKFLPLFGAEATGGSEYDASGKATQRGQVSARIAVEVDEVLQNGNLVLKGVKVIKINGEEQEIEISGVVRPDDVAPNNTVYSYNIANARVLYNGKLSLSNDKRKGFLTRITESIANILF